jgi:hypothetical protein
LPLACFPVVERLSDTTLLEQWAVAANSLSLSTNVTTAEFVAGEM